MIALSRLVFLAVLFASSGGLALAQECTWNNTKYSDGAGCYTCSGGNPANCYWHLCHKGQFQNPVISSCTFIKWGDCEPRCP